MPEYQEERRRDVNRDTFVLISNRDIYDELVNLRKDFQGFDVVRKSSVDHETRIRVLELGAARLWWVRIAAGAALTTVVADLIGRLFHVL